MSYGENMHASIIKPLVKTFFNVSANNFTMILNRKELANKLTMKMVKELKKKNRYENTKKIRNDNKDVATWMVKYC